MRFIKRLMGTALGAVLVVTGLAATPAHAIIGGTASVPSQYPYVVTGNFNGHGCDGTIIAPGWVLTAAHCAAEATTADQISIGVLGGPNNLHPLYFYVHPLWDGSGTDGHDLALLLLPNLVNPSTQQPIAPIQVGAPWDPGTYAAGNTSTIVGTGQTVADQPSSGSGVLRAVDTPLRSDAQMSDIYDPWYWFDDWHEELMIGAGSTNQTACLGDSGGPLLVAHNGRLVEVGVTSWGNEDCNRPAVFAELSGPQLAWIASIVPDITTRWGDCADVHGNLGISQATWSYQPWAPNDGNYYGAITCGIRNTDPPPPPPPAPTLQYFTGYGSGSKPAGAESQAISRVRAMATNAGFSASRCEEVDGDTSLNESGTYDAWVKLGCS